MLKPGENRVVFASRRTKNPRENHRVTRSRATRLYRGFLRDHAAANEHPRAFDRVGFPDFSTACAQLPTNEQLCTTLPPASCGWGVRAVCAWTEHTSLVADPRRWNHATHICCSFVSDYDRKQEDHGAKLRPSERSFPFSRTRHSVFLGNNASGSRGRCPHEQDLRLQRIRAQAFHRRYPASGDRRLEYGHPPVLKSPTRPRLPMLQARTAGNPSRCGAAT